MYNPGDSMIEVRELLIKAFASAWEVCGASMTSTDRNGYITSSITVIDSSGASVTHQVLIQGIAETSDSLETLTP